MVGRGSRCSLCYQGDGVLRGRWVGRVVFLDIEVVNGGVDGRTEDGTWI